MKLSQIACLALLSLLGLIPVLLAAQEKPTAPAPPPPRPQFFAGTVTDVNPGHVTVSRTLFGHPPEIRTFIVKPQTKTNRTVRVRSRVTVRYQSLPDGDVALEIQVRSQPKAPPKPS
ncbi:MAG TPA: hypothetical protein VH325_07825 [Bryobacteraceae bacterium]|nr:hypothetical protein [Bryobacteraceae bacterium]